MPSAPRRTTPDAFLSFIATLAHSGPCLTFDNEGAAVVRFALAQPDGAKVAAKIDGMVDRALMVVVQPYDD